MGLPFLMITWIFWSFASFFIVRMKHKSDVDTHGDSIFSDFTFIQILLLCIVVGVVCTFLINLFYISFFK
ncbi:hypothetical protein [Aliarcobacter lanthieri]|uniref:hypothetical protein n=1 Tax=Aliarcobacter lanthieri TaxID=1355374 RepID=UPI00047ED90E|nr:hypothetical protein [Aliarcobacter lanthieri]QKF59259.1 putative membrane protein [Aliarcobacter lanthieri]